jgi:hypothetical protein
VAGGAERQHRATLAVALECRDDRLSGLVAADPADEINDTVLIGKEVVQRDDAALAADLYLQPLRVVDDGVGAAMDERDIVGAVQEERGMAAVEDEGIRPLG